MTYYYYSKQTNLFNGRMKHFVIRFVCDDNKKPYFPAKKVLSSLVRLRLCNRILVCSVFGLTQFYLLTEFVPLPF